jgi:hypothetical protein
VEGSGEAGISGQRLQYRDIAPASVIGIEKLFVDAKGLVYGNDYNGGLYILKYNPKL